MREYRSLVFIVLAIFALTLLGAYFSPSFQEKRGYLELFFLMGGLLFILSALTVFAYLGFSSFALYLALFLALVIAMFGIIEAVVVIVLTYVAWGSVFAMEVLLFDAGMQGAKEWFMQRYTFAAFKIEFYAFYPMIGFIYLLLEVLPGLLSRDSIVDFSPSRVLKEMEALLK